MKMKPAFLILFLVGALSHCPSLALDATGSTQFPLPQVSTKGKLLYETDFNDTKRWRVSSGDWVPGNHEISATQTKGEKHSAHMVTNQGKAINVIYQFEVYIGESSTIEITIDDKPKKLGRIALNSKAFRGLPTHRTQKTHPIEKVFNVVEGPFAKDQWHQVCVEVIDNRIVAQLGESTSSSIDDAWAGKPKRLGLLVKKGPGKFRNLKIWEALPKE